MLSAPGLLELAAGLRRRRGRSSVDFETEPVTLPPSLLMTASASGRVRFGRVPGQDERLARERQVGRAGAGRARPARARRRRRRGRRASAWFSGSWKNSKTLAATTGPISGTRSSSSSVADAERVERPEPLGQDLGAPGADVADRQAGQEAVERPGLARLDRRDEVVGRLLAHPFEVGEGRLVEPVEVGEAS